MRRPLIAGNWKMYKTVPEAVSLAREVAAGAGSAAGEVDVLVAPPFTALHAVKEALGGSAVALGAQDMHWESEGAFTGAVSPVMLRDAGCSHVILGHSERRQLFGETDESVARKAAAALAQALTPILCVGETLAERESGRTMEVVERQVERALRALSPDQVAGLVIAYEPVWAIGTGRTATPAQAQELHSFIRKRVATSHGEPAAGAARILYGGSVKPDNIRSLMAEPDIDGALVGGASLGTASFLKIVRYPAA
ncbi:MAG TPA: triose-phosphate isomerase [Vicinamibacteria bacterium]|nr:triose-phosphate isomerase [Vicinamibacteria bacterium]